MPTIDVYIPIMMNQARSRSFLANKSIVWTIYLDEVYIQLAFVKVNVQGKV